MYPRALHTGVSVEEFLSLPESHDRIELLDGEVFMSPSPTDLHQAVVSALHLALQGWARQHPPARVGLSPLDVRVGPERIVQPDLFVVSAGWKLGAGMPLEVRPDLVVEVTSRNRSYDRITKRQVYFEAGIPEYWIVDLSLRQVEVIAGQETLGAFAEGQVTSRVLGGLAVPVSDIFPAE